MSILGRWRIVEMPDYTDDYPDVVEPADILFEEHGSGEFAFGCVTGQIFGGSGVEAQGDGWVEIQPDGSLKGQICSHGGDEANFTARRMASSTAC